MRRLLAHADATQVWHAPAMLSHVVQGALGGRRWEDARRLAEHLTEKAIVEEMTSATRSTRRAFGVRHLPSAAKASEKRSKLPSPSSTKSAAASKSNGKTKVVKKAQSENALVVSQASSSDALVAAPKRLVRFDVLDCTFGTGGHSEGILQAGAPYARVVAMDCDYATARIAEETVSRFGPERFRFFCNRMSESLSMFGEDAFDAVIVDPGPTETQVMDPRRGFLVDDENSHPMDMRYGPQLKMGALEYLNTCSRSELREALARYSLLSSDQAARIARFIAHRRPFYGSHDVVAAVSSPGEEFSEDVWQCQATLKKMPLPNKFLLSLRGIVNNEWYELKTALENGLLLLRNGGRLVVLTYLKWEEALVNELHLHHPHALLLYQEDIDVDEVKSTGASRHTKLWVLCKTNTSAFVVKNINITEEEVQDSALHWVLGAGGGQTRGFPAQNFTFKHQSAKERRIAKANREAPPFDKDMDHFDHPRRPMR